MTPTGRPLTGCVINISVSESDDSASLGFPYWQVNRTTLQLVAALFGQGATILFGHDWREDGVMEAVYGFARQVQAPMPPSSPTEEGPNSEPLLINLLPWPDEPYLPERDRERLAGTLEVTSAGLPSGLQWIAQAASDAGRGSTLYRYIRARGLTHLRHKLNLTCHARLCIGGRRFGSAGRYPGVIEEALFALRASKPLYLAGLLGGATSQIIQALEGRLMPDDFCKVSEVRSLYLSPPVQDVADTSSDDRIIDREKIWNEFASVGVAGLAESTRLTREELIELLHTRAVDRVIELVLISLSRFDGFPSH